jgi:hypothetical protein
MEKKTPQAFRVRGLFNEASSSSHAPAPVSAMYYRQGVARCHLSLKFHWSVHDLRKRQGMSTH